MHIILGLLGTLVTLLILVKRLSDAGIDIGWLNPFAWHRRRSFRQQHDTNPAFTLDSPLDAAALAVFVVARSRGEMVREDKAALKRLFMDEFNIDASRADSLLVASSYLVNDDIYHTPERIFSRTRDQLAPPQIESLHRMLNTASMLSGDMTAEQRKIITKIRQVFASSQSSSEW